MGEIDFLFCAAAATIPGMATGVDATIIAAPLVGLPYVMVARQDIHSVQELKGRKIGINRQGDLDDRLSHAVLEQEHMPADSVQFIPAGGQTDRYKAVLGGLVDAVRAPRSHVARRKRSSISASPLTCITRVFSNSKSSRAELAVAGGRQDTMRAAVLRRFGPPDVLQVEKVPTPEPGAGEVLVQVHAVSVNRTLDVLVRQDGNNRGVKLPHVLGVDPSGVIVSVGPGVQDRKVGDRVAVVNLRCGTCRYCLADEEEDCQTGGLHVGIQRWGGYAEYVCVADAATVVVPDTLSFPEATVILRHFPTAFTLARRAALRAGEWVLVMGAAGSLGACCIQVAKLAGAQVIAAAGADERVQAAIAWGADFGVNYQSQAAEIAAPIHKRRRRQELRETCVLRKRQSTGERDASRIAVLCEHVGQ